MGFYNYKKQAYRANKRTKAGMWELPKSAAQAAEKLSNLAIENPGGQRLLRG